MFRIFARSLLHMLGLVGQIVSHDHHGGHGLVQATIVQLLLSALLMRRQGIFFRAVTIALTTYRVHLLVFGQIIQHEVATSFFCVPASRFDHGRIRHVFHVRLFFTRICLLITSHN